MTSGNPFREGDLVLVKLGHGVQADLKPWMELTPAKVRETTELSTLVSWTYLGPKAPYEVKKHYSWQGGWYIDNEHLRSARTPNTTHEAW